MSLEASSRDKLLNAIKKKNDIIYYLDLFWVTEPIFPNNICPRLTIPRSTMT